MTSEQAHMQAEELIRQLPEDLDDAVEVLEHLAQIRERLPSLVAGRKLH